MTNFEYIKAMDKAEMMELLFEVRTCGKKDCDECPLCAVDGECSQKNILRWLESEV